LETSRWGRLGNGEWERTVFGSGGFVGNDCVP
jgi:hypothetical protein